MRDLLFLYSVTGFSPQECILSGACMQTITVGLDERSYPLYIGSGILPQLGRLIKDGLKARKYAIITDERVAALYGKEVQHILQENGLESQLISFPEGEGSKNLTTIGQMASTMANKSFDRGDAILALGGGVSGDMAGFLAAIYMRGISFVQVPTTLLSQVDSSVGGKTGVDIPEGKNLLGAFYQPKLVLIDTDVLRTLPPQEFLGGMGEVIKYGASLDADFFMFLKQNREQILSFSPEHLSYLIYRCCELKAQIVEQDEREGGLRRVLNFGHTIGHAVEAASNYSLIHGFAVSIGMRAVADLALREGLAGESVLTDLTDLLQGYRLPTAIPAEYDRERIIRFMQADKKTVGKRLFFVLPKAIGQVVITDVVSPEAVRAVLGEAS